ncbi:MAG: hypothetical protein GVY16_12205 [Planctomycetes bacterium]|jgi:membrane-associated HD superfamily phosphohydrolase|nr:hypothetical protein [Planctomycetota bacterium]
MNASPIVEIIAAAIMAVGLIALVHNRIKTKKGIGLRAIQFLCLVLVVPTILILGLQGIATAEVVAGLLGTIIGYVLAGIGDDTNA